MAQDQYRQQDPRFQYARPGEQRANLQRHPGSDEAIVPDPGESTYKGSGRLVERVLKTNICAMFWLCKAAIPHMPPGGSIINTASVQAAKPSPELMDYALTKFGIVVFAKALAADMAGKGIRFSSVRSTSSLPRRSRATSPAGSR